MEVSNVERSSIASQPIQKGSNDSGEPPAHGTAAEADSVDKGIPSKRVESDSTTSDYYYDGPRLIENNVTLEFVTAMIDMFCEGTKKTLPDIFVKSILEKALNIFKQEPSLVHIDLQEGEKLTICGDIHGQFFDLMNIFEMNNFPKPDNPYLFNGDIVDRGAFSVECILTLLSFKILYSNKFFISRGNHECAETNLLYGFKDEMISKYPEAPWLFDKFQEVFDWLPLAHLINGKIFVVHGGLSGKKGLTLNQIQNIRRGRPPPASGVMTDLLWSDPKPYPGVSPSHRGSGVLFGPDVTEDFCLRNNIKTIVRSHEVQADGYSSTHSGRIITVFSAPNYCDIHGNAGAYITIKGGSFEPRFHVFHEVEHPYVQMFTDITLV